MLFLWLNSDKTPQTWIEKLDTIRSKGSFIIDTDLGTRLATTNHCLGLIIRKDAQNNNMTATLTSWDCSRKTPLICLLDASQFTVPRKPVKFPCIPQNGETRGKRESAEGGTDFTGEYGESKHIINTFVNVCNSTLNMFIHEACS